MLLRGLCVVGLAAVAAACQGTDDGTPELRDQKGADVQTYLDMLPGALVVDADAAGVPNFLTGELARVAVKADPNDVDLRNALEDVAPVFLANPSDLVLKKAYTDNIGDQHFRFRQTKNGLDVIRGELILHVRNGVVVAVNGSAKDDPSAPAEAEIDAADAIAIARDNASTLVDAAAGADAPLAYYLGDRKLDLVYVVDVTGVQADSTPVHDKVLVNAIDGSIVDRMHLVHTALNREMHNLNHGSALPGPLARTEGQAATGESSVDQNYDLLGWTYNCYKNLFARDSYNNAGAKMISSVHYSTNYCNAYWNSTQMVYGDGNSAQGCGNLALSMDVTAHELTHAVTENESNLTYSGESGGLNESMSDVFGNVCELYRAGGSSTATTLGTPSANTWLVGEDVLAPYLRKMSDPAADGSSLDFWTSSAGSVDVHYSSGIQNLAFYLLSQGGTHPRGKSTVNVTGIGINSAAKIFYKANADYMTASTNFAGAKTATEQAATALGLSTASVTAAWAAVGVGSTTPPTTTPLTNGVPVSNISGTTGNQKFYSLVVPSGQTSLTFTTAGGSGDVDLYVKLGSQPSTTSYNCKSESATTVETCTIANPTAGTWYVLLSAYATYSGVTLTGTYSASGGTCTGATLQDGVPISNISGATGSSQTWKMCVPAGKSTLTFNISGGTGDADMYDCRPYLTGNAETCTFNSPSGGAWYVRLKGYTTYSGVTLKGDYP
jgi:vibriolysin